ncbi:polysialic acid transporter [Calothrix sp. 336/3]|nr:polysialic acid transporter [Calothrix sp. 336/3]
MPSHLPEVIYTPASQLRYPSLLVKQMWRDLLASRELAWRLMVRDVKAQYRQSFFGIAWAFLPSIFMALGFTLAQDAQVIHIGKTDIPYPVYLVFNTVLWQTFVEALNAPIQAVIAAKGMLARVNFPREALILAKIGETLFNFTIKTLLIILLFIIFKVSLAWTVIFTPLAIINLIFLGTFIGIFLAPLGILYQDISRAMTLLTGFWLLLTPVIYPVPQRGIFSLFVKFNPVTPLLVTARELTTTGIISQPENFAFVTLLTLCGLFITWVIFRLAMPYVIERVSS